MREQIRAQIEILKRVSSGIHREPFAQAAVDHVIDNLESAIRPQWVPINDPPKKPCFAFVRTIEGDVDVTHYMGDLGWGGYDSDDLTHWHEIDYPNPPESSQ